MTGKGWTWLGSDGSASSTFKRSPNLQRAMQGMVGTRPRGGKGAIYEKYLKDWKESGDDEFPGVIHTSKTEQVNSVQILIHYYQKLWTLSCILSLLNAKILSRWLGTSPELTKRWC